VSAPGVIQEGVRLVLRTLQDAASVHGQMDTRTIEPVVHAGRAILECLRGGGRVLVFGNGGSAAEAQHFAAELVGRYMRERRAVAAVALTTDTSALTAIGNDYGFDRVFARQIEALGRSGDIALGISTSGASPNVLEGLRTARQLGLKTVAFTGRDGGPIGAEAEIHVNIPHHLTPRIQEVQLTLLHALCDLIEAELEGG
jgi:D-sedoheptulose 7-phosphate isomerase